MSDVPSIYLAFALRDQPLFERNRVRLLTKV